MAHLKCLFQVVRAQHPTLKAAVGVPPKNRHSALRTSPFRATTRTEGAAVEPCRARCDSASISSGWRTVDDHLELTEMRGGVADAAAEAYEVERRGPGRLESEVALQPANWTGRWVPYLSGRH
ncbi:hypothetical protein [Isoptericola haloaureus]|uniref:Uncharacterized protein n=1 Tax=Isoptericola haloaureus TaxID=1542902 RepID=A0ABU7Z8K4_9MICO